jgi:flagellar biosynthesis GTPase FlhF
VALSGSALAAAAASLGHRSLVLIDFPGAGPRDGDRLTAHARALESLAPTEICAVLPADADEHAMQRQLEVFTQLGATHIVLSRVDLAARLEPALRAIVASGIPLAWVAHGSTTLGDLSPATRDWIDRASGQVLAAS